MKKRVNLFTQVEEEFKIRLKVYCIKKGLVMAEFIREAVEEKLDREK